METRCKFETYVFGEENVLFGFPAHGKRALLVKRILCGYPILWIPCVWETYIINEREFCVDAR